MKKITLLFFACGIIGLAFTIGRHKAQQPLVMQLVEGESKAVAVLELFTSEGCNSCPSADRLLPELAKLDPGIITLSFHVDYWDRLGWKDPFSSRIASDRQKEYGKQFKLTSIYTPQLVVNGQYELVGNVRSKAELTIRKVLAEKAAVSVIISDLATSPDHTISFNAVAAGDTTQTEIQAALVQKMAVMKVNAGENSGAILTHYNVVRSFAKQYTAAQNQFKLQLPAELQKNEWMLVVYVRHKKTLRITGAATFQPE
jgi:hypothetical protein